MEGMRYRRAVEKLWILSDACAKVRDWPPGEPFLREVYVFGAVLDGADPLDCLEVALTLHLTPDEVPWESHPYGTEWLADMLRLSKGGYAYFWRSHRGPVQNHHIRCPVRIWSSAAGAEHGVLRALEERRFGELPRLAMSVEDEREQWVDDLEAALRHLRAVHASYWDPQWRSENRGSGRYPEHRLWEAVEGYLDLHEAANPESGRPD